jgi:hypothetical protein
VYGRLCQACPRRSLRRRGRRPAERPAGLPPPCHHVLPEVPAGGADELAKSKRLTHLWRSVPCLDLDDHDTEFRAPDNNHRREVDNMNMKYKQPLNEESCESIEKLTLVIVDMKMKKDKKKKKKEKESLSTVAEKKRRRKVRRLARLPQQALRLMVSKLEAC